MPVPFDKARIPNFQSLLDRMTLETYPKIKALFAGTRAPTSNGTRGTIAMSSCRRRDTSVLSDNAWPCAARDGWTRRNQSRRPSSGVDQGAQVDSSG